MTPEGLTVTSMPIDSVDAALHPLTVDVEKTLLRHQRRFLSYLERRVGSRAEAEEILYLAAVAPGAAAGGCLGSMPSRCRSSAAAAEASVPGGGSYQPGSP